jgi:hypothetical protein
MRWALLLTGSFLVSFAVGRWLGMLGSEEPGTNGAAPVHEAAFSSISKEAGGMLSSTRLTAPQSLAEALSNEDPLTSAAQALAWIRSATLEDFRKLAADPDNFPAPELRGGFMREHRNAVHDSLFARWFALDPEGALAQIQTLDKALHAARRTHEGELMIVVARVRPDLILEHRFATDGIKFLDTLAEVAFKALAANNTSAARAHLLRITDPEARRAAEVVIERSLAHADPLGTVPAAKRLKSGSLFIAVLEAAKARGPGMLGQVIAALGNDYDAGTYLPWLVLKEPELAGELASFSRFVVSDQGRLALSEQCSPEDRARFIASYEELPQQMRAEAGAAVASGWARTEPENAAAWALSQARPDEHSHPENQAVNLVFLRWVNNAPANALGWWRALPPSPLKNSLAVSASTYVAEGGSLDLALEMIQPGISHASPDLIGQMGQLLARRDPAEAAKWLEAVPDTADTTVAAKLVLQAMYTKAPEEAAAYVESLPSGKRRDQFATAFTEQAAYRSPADAAEWVSLIDDPVLRRQAAMGVYEQWRQRNPATAQRWMRSLSGVDGEWHSRFLRTMK